MTPGEIAANVAWSNTVSGGRNPGVDRVLWVQGDMDPWYPLGVVEGPNVLIVRDASHHFWTHIAKESDQPSVKRARALIKAQIRTWLRSQPAEMTGLPTVPTVTDAWATANEFDRVTIAHWFDTWGSYVAGKEFEPAKHLFATEAVGFGTWMDYVEGRDDLVNHQWRNVWPTISSFHHRTEDTLRVTVSADRLSAVGLVLWTSIGSDEFGTHFERPGRTTAVFIRYSTEGEWLCIHTHVSLAKGVPQKSYLQPQAHREVVIQPVVCTNANGIGAARYTVDMDMVGNPFAAWGITLRVLPTQEWHNSNARDGLWSLDDLTVAAAEAGLYDPDSSVIHVFFVNSVGEHTGLLSPGQGSNNIAYVALDGAQDGEGSTEARNAVAVAHELGRCLGLPDMVDGVDVDSSSVNVMGGGPYEARLSTSALLPYQAADIRESQFAVPTSTPVALVWPASTSSVTLFYSDVESAARFYREELGLTQLPGSDAAEGYVDFQIASTSILELRSNNGDFVHRPGEAKATALAFVTEDIDAWDTWATDRGWQRSHAFQRRAGSAHDGFVTTDPEGYKLEFEVFNPHPENAAFLRLLRELPPVPTTLAGARKSFSATISWLYYQSPERARSFHRGTLGLPLVAMQPVTRTVAAHTGSAHMADIYHTSRSGFFGAVDERNGMADWANPAAVVLSFGLADASAVAGMQVSLQALGVSASLRNDEEVGYSGTAIHDVEGYSMQWRSDTRLDGETVVGHSGSSACATTWWNGGTLVAGVLLAFIAAWCGWAARGSLSKKGNWSANEADEMKRMLQDE
jgi:ketosteroid isomerase-like protein